MPLGSFRLNSLAKYEAPSGPTWNKSTRYNNDLTITGTNITQSTTSPKFGSASLYANSSAGSGDYFETVVTYTDFAAGAWTIEGFYKLGQIDGSGTYRSILGSYAADNNSMAVNLRSFGSGSYYIEYYWQGENWNGNANGTSGTLTANTWYHWAIARTSNTINVYGNGTRTSSRSTAKSNLFGTAGKVRVFGIGGGSSMTSSYQDAFRLSNSARYTGTTLTVPTAEYTSDANTKLIMNFNGANGSNITTDSTT
jgi:hypothetical protein